MKSLLASLLLGTLAVGKLPGAMLIDNYSSGVNDRFAASEQPGQFLLAAFDLSGIGQTSTGQWATLIGPTTVLSANHFQPTGSIFFHLGNDPAATPIELTLSGESERVNGTDLWLGRLTSSAPAGLRIYEYATTPISAPLLPFLNFPYRNSSVYMTGLSPSSFPAIQNQAFGTNVISGFVENNTAAGLGSVDAFELAYNPGATSHESYFRSGDSGAPLFIADGTDVVLLGINSYVSATGTGAPAASFVSYVGNESAALGAFAAVPEPATLVLALVATAFILLIRSAPLPTARATAKIPRPHRVAKSASLPPPGKRETAAGRS